jgi:integrase
MIGPIFTASPKSTERLTTRSLRRRIDLYLRMSGLKRKGLSAHSLRSTSATLIMENGGTLLELQQHLGHKSPETTIRYLARIESLADKAIQKFPFEVK